MKDFLEDLGECWFPLSMVALILAFVIGTSIYAFREDKKMFEAIRAYDNEHCIRYEATSMYHRKCVCYDNEKCANFVQEIR